MNTYKISSLIKHSIFSIVFIFGIGFSSIASAIFIDFDTRQDGTPYTGLSESFLANEYNGVVINDSDPASGSTYVNQINSINAGTAISGYYVNIGAFSATPQTQLALDFTTVITDASFDFANPTGSLTVSAFNVSGTSLGVFNFIGTDLFVNQAGFGQNAGHVNIFGIGEIASLLIKPDSNQALIFDNLNFSPVSAPEPSIALLIASGLMVFGLVRHKA